MECRKARRFGRFRFAWGISPPRILSAPAKSIVNNRYDYQVEATDAESDAITFSLETAPPGHDNR